MHAINASKWSTRGWTYQEAVLSRRRLVFTEHQVYFECNVMNCYESSHHAMDFLHTKDRSKKRSFVHPGMFAGIDLSKDKEAKNYAPLAYLKFLTHLMNFTSRNLTYESDALNAFSGIAQSFQNVQFSPTPIHHLWGLPLEFPSPGVSRQIQRLSLVNSLTWFHEVADGAPAPQRRHGFPSWSWSGWKGKVVIQRLFDEDWKLFSGGHSNSGLPQISIELKNGSFLPIESCSARWLYEHDDQLTPFLHITGRILCPTESEKFLNMGAGHRQLLSTPKAWHEPEPIRRRLKTREWQCMVLSHAMAMTYLLVFEQRGDTAERVGMLCGKSNLTGIGQIKSQKRQRRKIRFG